MLYYNITQALDARRDAGACENKDPPDKRTRGSN